MPGCLTCSEVIAKYELDGFCCISCHEDYEYDSAYGLIDLSFPDGTTAWVCCAVWRALEKEGYYAE